jgi:hypothetical protein
MRPGRIYLSSPISIVGDNFQAVREFTLRRLVDDGWEIDEFNRSGRVESAAWSFQTASEVMRTSQGAVILALPRTVISDGRAAYPVASEFSHFEGALAVAHGVPRFVVVAEGIPGRGIAFQGGGDLFSYVPDSAQWADDSGLGRNLDTWLEGLKTRRDVFLAFCSGAASTAQGVKSLLEGLGARVLDWSADFHTGRTIIEQIDQATRECQFGVFLFTKDDALKGSPGRSIFGGDGRWSPARRSSRGPVSAVPRDNVVFEAGYFMSRHGGTRTLVILERGAKMPADLGGVVYADLKDRSNVASIEATVRKFLDSRDHL